MSESTRITCDGCGGEMLEQGAAFAEIETRGEVRSFGVDYDTKHLCWSCRTTALRLLREEINRARIAQANR